MEYPPALYGLAICLGALPYYYVLALVGQKFKIPTWILIAAIAAIVLGVVIDRLRRRGKQPT
jgi:high-affinity Fe2+/Pb2+ permease